MISNHKYVHMLMVIEYGLVEVVTYQNTILNHGQLTMVVLYIGLLSTRECNELSEVRPQGSTEQ